VGAEVDGKGSGVGDSETGTVGAAVIVSVEEAGWDVAGGVVAVGWQAAMKRDRTSRQGSDL
jgi:hypothetical protein